MKIFFFPGDYQYTYYYRGYLPGIYSDNLVVTDFLQGGKNAVNHNQVSEYADRADVIVFQRPLSAQSLTVMQAYKDKGKKIIYENDDTYRYGVGIVPTKLENDVQRRIAQDLGTYTEKALILADGAIASTEFLAREFLLLNPNVAVLKNCIDPLDARTTKPNTTRRLRVGIIGSVTTNDDYLHIKEAIRALDTRGDVTFVILGIKYRDGSIVSFMREDRDFWASLTNIEWYPYVPVTEYMQTVASLAIDVALIPRENSYFNRCKSNLKFLEMSLLKIPVIAQGFPERDSPYQGVDEPYMTVLVDNGDPEVWYNTIIDLKEHYSSYKERAEAAHDYVLKNYNIETYAPTWVSVIETLCKYPKTS